MTARHYLDYNATTPLKPAVQAAMRAALDISGNPSSIHAEGRAAKAALDGARAALATVLQVSPAQIIFTSGGTEANQLALRGLSAASLLIGATEHDCIRQNFSAHIAPHAAVVPVLPSGLIDLTSLSLLLQKMPSPCLVAIMAANNETGVIQPVAEIAAMVKAAGGLFHCDAVQAFGKLPLSFADYGADSIAVSAHKIGGPKGVGALILRANLGIAPQLLGGGQEMRRRAGTENLIGVVGFAAACHDIEAELNRQQQLAIWRDDIMSACAGAHFYGLAAPRLANTLMLGMPDMPASTQLMQLDLVGLAVSTGAACSSGKVAPSHVLQAMGVSPKEAGCAIRVSLGFGSSSADIEAFIACYNKLLAKNIGKSGVRP